MTATPTFGEAEEDRRLQFLLDEGLILLAAYRRIADPAMRLKILALVEEAGRTNQMTRQDGDSKPKAL